MKAISTIKREIGRLKRISENERFAQPGRDIAFETYNTLLWVINDVKHVPTKEISRYLRPETRKKK